MHPSVFADGDAQLERGIVAAGFDEADGLAGGTNRRGQVGLRQIGGHASGLHAQILPRFGGGGRRRARTGATPALRPMLPEAAHDTALILIVSLSRIHSFFSITIRSI